MKDYVPNEKYRNMFGVQRQGYGMERVDLYLEQLEVAFKKIREDNRSLKRELAGREGGAVFAQPNAPDPAAAQQQDFYIAQLQQQLAVMQEQNHRLQEQLQAGAPADSNDLRMQLHAAHAELEHLRHQANTPSYDSINNSGYEEDLHCIAKTLVDARRQADDTLRCAEQDAHRIAAEITGRAEQEADAMLQKARRRVEELTTERDRLFNQLQGVAYAVRNVLRDTGEPVDFHQARQAHADYRMREQNIRQAR